MNERVIEREREREYMNVSKCKKSKYRVSIEIDYVDKAHLC